MKISKLAHPLGGLANVCFKKEDSIILIVYFMSNKFSPNLIIYFKYFITKTKIFNTKFEIIINDIKFSIYFFIFFVFDNAMSCVRWEI
jgi:hypothetical protein